MSYFFSAIISLLIAVGLIVGAAMWGKSLKYKETDKVTCGLNNYKPPRCGAFNGSTCWKGSLDPNNPSLCVKPPNYGILVILILSGLFAIVFVVYLVLGFSRRCKSGNAFAFGSSCSSCSSCSSAV